MYYKKTDLTVRSIGFGNAFIRKRAFIGSFTRVHDKERVYWEMTHFNSLSVLLFFSRATTLRTGRLEILTLNEERER